MLWPVAALVVYFSLSRSARLPALEGISLPLAVLAVRGWARLRLPGPVAVAAVAVAVLPGMVYSAQTFRDTVDAHGVPYTIRDDERAALRYLAHRPPRGPVLSPDYIGTTVPALAGRRTLAAYPALDLGRKGPGAVTAVFDAHEPIDMARGVVRKLHPPFLLSDCRHRTNLTPALAPLGYTRRGFGCAAVYERGVAQP